MGIFNWERGDLVARKYADDSDDDFEFEDDVEVVTESLEEAPEEEYETTEGAIEDDGIEIEEVPLLESPAMGTPARGRKSSNRAAVIVLIVLGVILAIAVAVAIILHLRAERPNTAMVDLTEYLEIPDGEIATYVNNERIPSPIICENGVYYITKNFVDENLTNKFYFDCTLGSILYTTATELCEVKIDSDVFFRNQEPTVYDHKLAIRKGDTIYLSLSFVFETDAYGYGYYVDEDPVRVHIFEGNLEQECITWAEGLSAVNIRVANTIHAALVTSFDPQEDESFWYISGKDLAKSGWTFVHCTDGRYGYVQNDEIDKTDGTKFVKNVREATPYPALLKDYDVLLGWQGVYSMYDNDVVSRLVDNAPTMNTISPTWYMVSDNDGNVSSFASQAYVDYVHGRGLEIWPLISDFNFAYNDDMNETLFLSSFEARSHLISVMMAEAANFGYDGWNIDFEHVPSECGPDFIQFIRELSIACRKAGLVLSVDNYVPRSWRMQYMREDQGECIDYYIVMGYDEHWQGCEEAGSTASIGFVKEGLDSTLLEVPANKVLMGVPFFTRLWKNTMTDDGPELTSTHSGMAQSETYVETLGLTKEWDESIGQYVAKGTVDGVYYSIWIENLDSMRVRLKAIRERNIAGIAAWALGFEMPETWYILEK